MRLEPSAPDPDEILALLATYPAGVSREAQLRRYAGGAEALAQALAAAADDLVHQDAPRARRLAQAALELAEPLGQPAGLARALRSLVQALAAVGQFEAALPLSLRAYELYESAGLTVEATRTLLGRAHVLAALGRYDDARAAAEQARRTFSQAGEVVLAGVAAMNLGNIHLRLDRPAAAEALYREARAAFAREGAADWLAQADFNLGNALMQLDRPAEAAEAFAQALPFFEGRGQAVAVAMLHANLGFLELRQCRYPAALQRYQQARDTFRALGMDQDVVQMDMEIAGVYLDVNLLAEAGAAFQQAAQVFERAGQRYEAGLALAQLALTRIRQRQFTRAANALDQARQIFDQEANAVRQRTCDLYGALLHLAQANWTAAYAEALQAAAGLAEPGLAARRGLAYVTAARAALAEGGLEQAGAHLSAAAECLAGLSLPTLTYHVEHWRGRLLLAEGRAGAAQAALEAAAAAADRVRQTLPGDLLRSAYREDKLGAHQALAALLLSDAAAGQVERAFDVIERAKALALAERLSQAPARDALASTEADELERRRAQLNWYYSAYTDGHPESARSDRQALGAALRAAEREWLEFQMRRDLLTAGQWAADAALTTLGEAQARLGAEEALLQYFVADGEVLALLIRDTRVEVRRNLSSESAVTALIERLRAHFARYGLQPLHAHPHAAQLEATSRAYLRQLFEGLVAPLAASLPRRLTVLPHGVLHYVPFHALLDGETFLAERLELAYAPSATLWSYCQARPRPALSSALVLAADDARAPQIAQETAAVQGLLADAHVLAGAQAAWSGLREHAAAADLIHVAAHATFREDNALFSALRLADGWVTVNDLQALSLRSALVVLTGCETGVSRVAPGDELLGLARAWLTAGAASLVVSLWPVHDASAAGWVRQFYSRLRSGLSPAAAVREAQLAVRQAWPDPYYWAPFVTIGRA